MIQDLKEIIFLVMEKIQLLKKVFLQLVKKMMIVLLGKLKQKKLITIKKKKLLIINMLGLKYMINQLYIFLNFFILIQLLKDSQVF